MLQQDRFEVKLNIVVQFAVLGLLVLLGLFMFAWWFDVTVLKLLLSNLDSILNIIASLFIIISSID